MKLKVQNGVAALARGWKEDGGSEVAGDGFPKRMAWGYMKPGLTRRDRMSDGVCRDYSLGAMKLSSERLVTQDDLLYGASRQYRIVAAQASDCEKQATSCSSTQD